MKKNFLTLSDITSTLPDEKNFHKKSKHLTFIIRTHFTNAFVHHNPIYCFRPLPLQQSHGLFLLFPWLFFL